VPHNLYITRGSRLDAPDAGEVYSTVRVYVWARKPSASKPLINMWIFLITSIVEECLLFGEFSTFGKKISL
jgi:hypothetical protein